MVLWFFGSSQVNDKHDENSIVAIIYGRRGRSETTGSGEW